MSHEILHYFSNILIIKISDRNPKKTSNMHEFILFSNRLLVSPPYLRK